MNYYFKCFDKTIHLKLYKNTENNLKFWLKRFCPNIEICDINDSDKTDLIVEFIENITNFDYTVTDKCIKIYGKLTDSESFIAKFITQCFQKLLIIEDILFVPAACVSNGENALLIIGDFWQGKTSVALNLAKKFKLNLLTDNYVAIKKGRIVGVTSYISIRKEDVSKYYCQSVLQINDRYFYHNDFHDEYSKKIIGFLLPYINNGDNNIHIISKEESKWYLYQKFIRLLSGESILFDGKLPSPIFIDKKISIKILKIVEDLMKNTEIKYTSAKMEKIVLEGYRIFERKN